MRAVTKEEMFKVTATREWIPWYGIFTQLKVPSLLSDAGMLKREELGNDIERMREVLFEQGLPECANQSADDGTERG